MQRSTKPKKKAATACACSLEVARTGRWAACACRGLSVQVQLAQVVQPGFAVVFVHAIVVVDQQRDSLTGAVTISQASDSLHRAALDSANRRQCPAPPAAVTLPSRALWASLGALAMFVTTVLFLSR